MTVNAPKMGVKKLAMLSAYPADEARAHDRLSFPMHSSDFEVSNL
jgi:hypothetical protein